MQEKIVDKLYAVIHSDSYFKKKNILKQVKDYFFQAIFYLSVR